MIDKVKAEPIIDPKRFEKAELSQAFLKNELERCQRHTKKIIQRTPKQEVLFPSECPVNGMYPLRKNIGWTEGFWTGINWLLVEGTGQEMYQQIAQVADQNFQERMEGKIIVDHHDLGFLYSLSTVAEYKLRGTAEMREVSIEAADQLLQRFWKKAGVIQAWGDPQDPQQQGRMIMDCCMNLPLLFWAHQETGEEKYKTVASTHLESAGNYLVREDGSTFHTYYMDITTGNPRFGSTHQGYSDDSCWARGQAWGIYGFAIGYRYLKEERYYHLSKKLTNYLLNRLPEDFICYWDLVFEEGSSEERDTSSMAIAVCGILELLRYPELLSEEERSHYQKVIYSVMHSLAKNYATNEEEDGFLTESVYNKPKDNGVGVPCIWGDYFYLEALIRLNQEWAPYW